MSKNTVQYTLNLANPPVLSAAQKLQIKRLKARPEKDIDRSDIPALTGAFWKQAVRNPHYRPLKASTTVRVDADVLIWLKSQGKGYQMRINAILREAMLKQGRTR